MKMLTLTEKHRNGIQILVMAISTVVCLIRLFVVRIAAGAGAMLAYLFFKASPDTTVYQLSQLAHSEAFWQGALCIALIYSGVLVATLGRSGSGHVVAAGSAAGQCATNFKEVERSPHPMGGEIITYAQDKKN